MDFEQKPLKKGQKPPPKQFFYLYICKRTFKEIGDENEEVSEEDQDRDGNDDQELE